VKKVLRFLPTCTISAALAISASLLASVPLLGQSPPQSVTQPVVVVNTPNVNVANTPSVSVTNTPNVTVTNTPNVNVANTPTVTLEAGAGVSVTSPLDGEGNPTPLAVLDAFQPYEDACEMGFGGTGAANCTFQPIPSGKRLVIQEFDATGTLETGLKPEFVGLIPSDLAHWFTATFMGTENGNDFFDTHQETRLYAPATATPYCFVGVTSNSNGVYECVLSGFLVDVPLGSSSSVQPHRTPRLQNRRNPLPGRQ
jgi:hypothetical protein